MNDLNVVMTRNYESELSSFLPFSHHFSHSLFASTLRVQTGGVYRSWNVCANWECMWEAGGAHAHTSLVGLIANAMLCDSLRQEKAHVCATLCQIVRQLVSCWRAANDNACVEALSIFFESRGNSSNPAISWNLTDRFDSIIWAKIRLNSSDGRGFHAHRILLETYTPTL